MEDQTTTHEAQVGLSAANLAIQTHEAYYF